MKLAAVKALAELTREEVPTDVTDAYGLKSGELKFGKDYIIPKPFDKRLLAKVSIAVAKAAIESGVAKKPITDWAAYEKQLAEKVK
jgi:malate dehydrogenase (oxaloacetate-decarboxylating)(NADP+)